MHLEADARGCVLADVLVVLDDVDDVVVEVLVVLRRLDSRRSVIDESVVATACDAADGDGSDGAADEEALAFRVERRVLLLLFCFVFAIVDFDVVVDATKNKEMKSAPTETATEVGGDQ